MSRTGGGPGGGRGVMFVAVVTVALVALSGVGATRLGRFRDIPGDFCRNRYPSECCLDGDDDCAVPILDTYCYCKDTCLTGDYAEDACCPDFWEVCLEEEDYVNFPLDQVTGGCEKDGVRIPEGESVKFNCNECTCVRGEVSCEENTCMIDEALIDQINGAPPGQYGWRAANYSSFWGRKAQEGLVLKTGTYGLDKEIEPIDLIPNVAEIPKKFDVRGKWPGRISGAQEQGWCGASWVFSTLGVAQDRLSMVNWQPFAITLSPQHLLSCIWPEEEACQGGNIEKAWGFIERNGVVSEDCFKYESGEAGKLLPCLISPEDLSNSQCPKTQRILYKTEAPYIITNKEENIQWEIMTEGPVQALMTVNTDLFMYESGVYSPSGLGDSATAPHSVRIVGWGEELIGDEVAKYWVVANSWGSAWGENGFFRIRRGQNVADIESYIIAVRPTLVRYS